MNRQSTLAFLSSLGIAVGAGLASALLFAAIKKGTLFAIFVAYFAPLPVMIAALGFGQWTGIIGAVLGTGLIAVLLSPGIGLLYAVGIGVPAWLVCFAALRGAPPAEMQPQRQTPGMRAAAAALPSANAAPMRALTIGTLYFAIAFSAGALALAAAHGGLNTAIAQLTEDIAPTVRELKSTMTSLPEGLDADRLARFMVRVLVPAIAGSGLMLIIANLWLAGRTVQISARLPTVWPDIPFNLRIPVPFAAALLPAVGLIFVGHEIGFVAAIVATVLATALSLQGLAVMHDLTRGLVSRNPLLFGAYLLMSFVPPWPMAVFAILGLADAALGLRERKRQRQSAPPPTI